MGRRVGGVGIGRLRLLLRLGVEKMVMAEKEEFLCLGCYKTREEAVRTDYCIFDPDSANPPSLIQQ